MRSNAGIAGTILILCVGTPACSRLDPLTESTLEAAEEMWRSHAPEAYRVVVEFDGERVERGRFEVRVRNGTVVRLTLDGEAISPDRSDDYSIEGLFGILRQELALAAEPRLLGAPEGYSAYLLARFDAETGRLEHYRRSVGGTSNTVDIRVVDFEPD